MIILQDLFTTLATTVYANTAFKGTDNRLKPEHYEKVGSIVNLGIVEIYKRFKLLENELTLHLNTATANYFLRASRVAPLISISPSLYIESVTGVDGFLNIIKVTSAYDADGTEIRINNGGIYNSDLPVILEMAPDILSITNILANQAISVVYQSYPNKLTETSYDNADAYELNIPDFIIDPLLMYIGAKTFKPMGANDSTANADKSASYEQQFELACQKLAMYGLSINDSTDRETFESNGWV